MKTMKTFKQLEGVVKGFSNHRRIEIMFLLAKNPGLALFEVSEEIGVDFRVASEHIRRLVAGGLVSKHYKSRTVIHFLTKRGRVILTFLRKLE